MKSNKRFYEIPQIELYSLSLDDVLTLSEGFDGEEDEFGLSI